MNEEAEEKTVTEEAITRGTKTRCYAMAAETGHTKGASQGVR